MATVVAFHAHPDDEALLTGGTLARLAAEGHRVVIVVATDGVVDAAPAPGLRSRLDELRASAMCLGAARVEHLGYADSGHGPILFPDPPGRVRFVRADPEEAAARLASLIRAERADLLISYDQHGGYGHRDHVRVHEVGVLAARLADVRVVEATAPRELAILLFLPLRLFRPVLRSDAAAIGAAFSPRSAITHRVDVRRYAAAKHAALASHRSQTSAARQGSPLARLLVRLPLPVFGLVLGREWFAEPGAAATRVSGDILQAAPRPG